MEWKILVVAGYAAMMFINNIEWQKKLILGFVVITILLRIIYAIFS